MLQFLSCFSRFERKAVLMKNTQEVIDLANMFALSLYLQFATWISKLGIERIELK